MMMINVGIKIVDILSEAQEEGVSVILNEGRLQLKVAKGKKASPKLVSLLKAHKEEIIAFLEEEQASVQSRNRSQSKIKSHAIESLDFIPLSFAQERLWFIDQLGGSTEYHIPTSLKIKGAFDIPNFKKAFKTIVDRHQILRTVIREKDGQVGQQIRNSEEWSIEIIEEGQFSGKEDLEVFVNAFIAQPFDLTQDFPIRISLVKTGPQEYLLLMVLHHIASDGWSGSLMIDEFAALYEGYQKGQKTVLPPLEIQYADYALWQRTHLEGAVLEQQLDYWKKQLAGVPPLELPTDFLRPSIQSTRGATRSIILDADLSQQLEALAQRNGVTLFMLFQTAINIILYKFSGQRDLCIGTPIAGRTMKQLESLIGFFVNTLPIRNQLDPEQSVEAFLNQIKKSTLDAYSNQAVPFEQLVEMTQEQRDLSRSPLFQVIFNFINSPDEQSTGIDDVQFEPYDLGGEDDSSKTDLKIAVMGDGKEFTVNFGYCRDLYKESTIDQILSGFKVLLYAMTDNPAEKIKNLDILSSTEREKIQQFGTNVYDIPEEETLVSLFEQQVAKSSQATALSFEDQTWTYEELHQKATQLANHLAGKNIGKEAPVAILLDRSAEMIIAILGILKSGATAVPIDPTFPTDRIQYLLKDTAAKVLITSSEWGNTFASQQPLEIIDLVQYLAKPKENEKAISYEIVPQDLAYILYTSGSTGEPKGVQLTHAALVNELLYQSDNFGVQATDRILQTSNYVFDAAIEQIFLALLNGACLVLIHKDTLLDTHRLEEVLEKQAVTHVHATPALLQNIPAKAYPGLKRVLAGGESCPMELVTSWSPFVDFYNKYGPTETAINSTIYCLKKGSSLDGLHRLPIGRPIGNTEIFLLDEFGQLTPRGGVGEVYIGGAGLSRGYLNNEQLTAEKFIPSPFDTNQRLYKTGDLARWLSDGQLEFKGRKDKQVKIRGQRIELEGLENGILSSKLVSSTVVEVRNGPEGQPLIIAYLISEEDYNQAKLHDYLKDRFPAYMLPNIYFEQREFPLTATGKIDKRRLPLPDFSAIAELAYEGPRNEIEYALTGIWEKMLKVEKVGIHNDFFELGGHSLLAMRVIAAIRNELNLEISIRELFTNSTIAELAAAMQKGKAENLLPEIKRQENKTNVPLSFAQERLWFIDKFEGSTQYHITNVLQLEGELNIQSFEEAFKALLERHEALRTVIKQNGKDTYQELIAADHWAIDYTADIFSGSKEELKDWIDQQINEPFNLSEDYLLRVSLLRTAEEQYVMAIIIHHIASDGWSSPIIIDEFTQLYRQIEKGEKAALPPLKIQYSDYAVWQRELEAAGIYDQQLAYWNKQLTDVPALSLQTDFPRPAVQHMDGGRCYATLDAAVATKLSQVAQAAGTTTLMLYLSAFKTLLFRYCGQDDLCIGLPIAGRLTKEVEPLVGLFVNTLAIRNQLSSDLKFNDLLQSVKETTLDAYANQIIPFEQVVESLKMQRDLSRNAVFQVLFNYMNTFDEENESLEGIKISDSPVEVDTFTLITDLLVGISEGGDSVEIVLGYRKDLFKVSSIQRMLDNYQVLLAAIADNAEQTIGQLPMIHASEDAKWQKHFDQTNIDYPREQTIVNLFEEQVNLHPDHTALVLENQSISYRDLNEKANQLARHLVKEGLGKEDIVALCLDRSFDMMIAILATIKAGGAYLPIDPNYPQERIQFLLEDSGARFAISQSKHQSLFKDSMVSLMNTDDPKLQEEETTNLNISIAPEQLIYIIYTSGTTGKPKGALLEHRNIVRLFKNDAPLFEFNPEEVWTLFHSYCFDFSVWEMYGALLFGGKLVIVPTETAKDAIAFGQLLEKESVTILNQTPAAFNALQHATLNSDCDLSQLKSVIFGGDALNPQQLLQWNTRYPDCQLINMYGITETTVHVTYKNLSREDLLSSTSKVGLPIPTLSCYLLDQNGQRLPLGASGELYVGGEGVARGYLNRPELTAERFLPNPFDQGKSRLYRTGDLARLLPEGDIEYLGRIDNQVKIRGYRIELNEIRTLLEQSPMINQGIVLAKEGADGHKQLVAYVVTHSSYDKHQLLSDLKSALPAFMVPGIVVEIDHMPMTRNGKIDKKALPDPFIAAQSDAHYRAPATDLEKALSKIWGQLLEIEQVGLEDNFFELGGHSLLATRIVSAIRASLNVEIRVRDLFIYPTIEELSAFIETLDPIADLPSIRKMDRPERIPLSFAQERLWFIDRLQGSVAYHIPSVLKINGALDTEGFNQCFRAIIDRHEVLRSIIKEEEGQAFQQIKTLDDWNVELIQPSAEDKGQLHSFIEDYITAPFDLTDEFPIRVSLVELEPDQYLLIIVLHHIASDGWSAGLIVDEFSQLYNAHNKQEEITLPELSIQYADYAIWQREYLADEVLTKQLNYWENQLANVPPLELPTDYPRPAIQSTNGESRSVAVSSDLSAQLQELAKQNDITLFMLFLGALKVILYKFSQQRDLCIGVPIAGRTMKEVEPLIGFFVNTLPLRSQLDPESSLEEFLGQVKRLTLDAYDHQLIPFEQLVEITQEQRDLSRNPLFQVLFNFLNTPEETSEGLSGIQFEAYDQFEDVESSKTDLKMSIINNSEQFHIHLAYCKDLYKASTIDQMLNGFTELLESMVNSPEKKLKEIEVLSKEEEKILNEFSYHEKHFPEGETLIGLFEKQALKTADATAVVFEDQQLTYEQLDQQSSMLAQALVAQGVGVETTVGIGLDRSFEMVIAILGIMKAGATVVPIDPAFPAERIKLLIEDADLQILISTEQLRIQFELREGLQILDIEACLKQGANQALHFSSLAKPENRAYILYTSGSTGRPKGVQLEHRGLVNELFSQTDYYQIDQDDHILQTANYIFDAAIEQIYLALMNGCQLILVSRDTLLDAHLLEEVIRDQSVSYIMATPGLLQNIEPGTYTNLKRVISVGESCPLDLVRKWVPYVDFYNGYGPTETSVISNMFCLKKGGSAAHLNSLPVGKPITNVQVYVLDEQLALTPRGGIGEVYIGGPGLSRGYLNNEVLTKEKFIDSPFDPEQRLYKTGDLARWLEDGNLEFKGRKDKQVKIRGQRIELEGIENSMIDSGQVLKAAVDVIEAPDAQKVIVAYLVPEESYSKGLLKKYLKENLPAYMVPAIYVEMESFPQTATAKIDRRSLPTPDFSSLAMLAYTAPQNELEESLVELWQQLLKVDQVGIHNDFFELGGHSLLAMKTIAGVRTALQIEVGVVDLFRYPTIAAFANHLQTLPKVISDQIKPAEEEDSQNEKSELTIEDDF